MERWCKIKNKFKKIVFTLGSATAIVAPMLTWACAQNKDLNTNLIKSDRKEYLIEREIQNSIDLRHFDASNIKRSDLDKLPKDMLGYFGTKFLAGGYEEPRYFYYDDPNRFYIHVGVDFFQRKGHRIVAPNDSDLLASYWVKTSGGEFGEGIGGIDVIRIKISNLQMDEKDKKFVYVKKSQGRIYKLPLFALHTDKNNDIVDQMSTKDEYDAYMNTLSEEKRKDKLKDEEYIYIGLMHLGEKGLSQVEGSEIAQIHNPAYPDYKIEANKNVDYDHPKALKKGDLLGIVGSIYDNGGWVPQIHINAYTAASYNVQRWKQYKMLDTTNAEKIASIQKAWLVGIYTVMRLSKGQNINDVANSFKEHPHPGNVDVNDVIDSLRKNHNYFDPNKVFDFYNNNDITVKVKL